MAISGEFVQMKGSDKMSHLNGLHTLPGKTIVCACVFKCEQWAESGWNKRNNYDTHSFGDKSCFLAGKRNNI